MKKILVMGLPGSGKSYLSKLLAPMLKAVWLNADKVRKQANDWDFSIEGRLRQAKRMADLSDKIVAEGNNVVADFICPTEEARKIYSPDYIIFMNTITSGRYPDTNILFEQPNNPDFEITKKDAELLSYIVANRIEKYQWNNQSPTAQMLGRYQPWHIGHKRLFEESLKKTGQVLIMVRDVSGLEENVFDFRFIERRIRSDLKDYGDRVRIVLTSNITNIFYGRDVGYNIEEIDLPADIKKISATKIRSDMRKKEKPT